MSNLLLAEKHHQLLMWNAESRLAREVRNTVAFVAHVNFGRLVRPNGAIGLWGPDQFVVTSYHAEVHVAEASRRPPQGSLHKPNPNGISIHKEKTRISLKAFNLGPLNLNQQRIIVISVDARLILQMSVESSST